MTAKPINQAWHALKEHAQQLRQMHLIDLFQAEADRVQRFSLECDALYLDYSKNFLTQQTLDLLFAWAHSMQLEQKIQQLFSAQLVNSTEQRAALHWALRWPQQAGAAVGEEIHIAWQRCCKLAERIRERQWLGYSGEAITDLLHIGIGGSDLGPALLDEALAAYHDRGIRCHFLASNDPQARQALLKQLPAATTLVVLVSKSFTSYELHDNRQHVFDWFAAQSGQRNSWQQQTIAVTASAQAAAKLGLPAEHILPLWDWLGGRFSISSAVSFSCMVQCGPALFQEFLNGAAALDQHFMQAPLEANMPVILALIALCYNHFFAASSEVVLAYSQALRLFPDYLQQLSMESLGKTVDLAGQATNYPTGMMLWGGVGPQSQHSFHQLLMQGSHFIASDFIVPMIGAGQAPQNQDLCANAIAQAHILMCGYDPSCANLSCTAGAHKNYELQALLQHKMIKGDRPSNFILMQSLSPYSLGQLVALYEHKVYATAAMLNINAFDQRGVERGKQIAGDLLQSEPSLNDSSSQLDASSDELWRRCGHV